MRGLENLIAFKLARELSVALYELTRRRPLSRHRVLANQIARAAISIPANIAEGYALGTRRQLVKGIRIAYGSAAELETHVWIAKRVGALSDDAPTNAALRDLDRVAGLLIGLLKRYGGPVGP